MITSTFIPLNERHFEIIDGALYVFELGLSESGLSIGYYRKERSIGNKRLRFIDHPEDNRISLVLFESMSKQHREQIENTLGNPYIKVVEDPIRKMVTRDVKAHKFYTQFLYDDNKKLATDKINEYTIAASWLNMLKAVDENKKEIKKQLGLSIIQFFDKVGEIIEQDKICLPSSYRFLKPKIEKYKAESYASLIHKQIGNKNNLKVKNEVAQAKLLEMVSNHNQPDDVLVCYLYNKWAIENNLPQISPATVGNWRRNNEDEVTIGRYGSSAFNEKFIRQVKGISKSASAPLRMVEHDDNNLDFLFINKDTGNRYNRYVSIVVIDSFCGLVLGKAYTPIAKEMGDTMQQLIRMAYVDAMYYIRTLVNDGKWYLPHELKSDRWAIGAMLPFYKSVGNFVKPAAGNKHRGYIEPFFGLPIFERAKKIIGQSNYNGHGMEAKFPGVNKQALLVNSKNRPAVGEEAELQIENFFHLLRHMPDFTRDNMNAPSKEQQWLEAWQQLPDDQKQSISDEQFLLTFGIIHNPDRPISITNRGIEPQIDNCKYSYDLPETWMYNKYPGEKVNVIYDPYDMSRVLVTNHKDIRFIAADATRIPRTLQDMKYNPSRIFLNAILSEKKEQVNMVADKMINRKKLAPGNHFDPIAVLSGGVLHKELKNQAEQKMIEDSSNEQESYLNDNYNFNQFFEQ